LHGHESHAGLAAIAAILIGLHLAVTMRGSKT